MTHKMLDLPAGDIAGGMTSEQKLTLGGIPPDLQSLFDRDPLSLTQPEINGIVSVLRAQRKNFTQAESEAKNAGRRVNAKKAIAAPKEASASLKMLLEDL